MLKWLREIFKKKQEINPCTTCVYWKSEAENNIIITKTKGKRYCDIYKTFTKPNDTCALYVEEKFEAKPDSIQTPELSLDIDTTVERVE